MNLLSSQNVAKISEWDPSNCENCVSWGPLSPVSETDFKRYHNILKWIHIKQNYHIVVFNFANGKKSLQTHTTQCFWHPPPKRRQRYIFQVLSTYSKNSNQLADTFLVQSYLGIGGLGCQASTENFCSLPYFTLFFFISSLAKQIQNFCTL